MSEELLLYQAPDGSSRIQVRLEGRTLWLTQQQLADLYESTPQNITQHIRAIYTESELIEAATCKPYLQVRDEAGRQVSRSLKHYNLDVVIAIGYRVRSHRGTQFRRWATDTLRDFLVKGFVLDDERFKGGHDDAYFEELLARVRDIRSSEKVFWKKVLDIYATSIDYDPSAESSQASFATVQNKMHWAAHGHTADQLGKGLPVGRPLLGRDEEDARFDDPVLRPWPAPAGAQCRRCEGCVALGSCAASANALMPAQPSAIKRAVLAWADGAITVGVDAAVLQRHR